MLRNNLTIHRSMIGVKNCLKNEVGSQVTGAYSKNTAGLRSGEGKRKGKNEREKES